MGGGLHPNVVEPQNRGFTPTSAEVKAARKVLELYEDTRALGKASASIDGVAVDWYEARRARELLDWAALCARRNRGKEEAVAKAMKDADDS